MLETTSVKFSNMMNDTSGDDAVYDALIKFIMKLAHRNASDTVTLMEYDEIVGELLEELAKGLKHYSHLPNTQRLAVIRRMLDNRIAELRYKYYLTHRKASIQNVSLEAEDADTQELRNQAFSVSAKEPKPEEWIMSLERVTETRRRLSPAAAHVFDCLMQDDGRLVNILALHIKRASNSKSVSNVKAWMVADALLLTEEEVSVAFNEIKMVYERVCRGAQ